MTEAPIAEAGAVALLDIGFRHRIVAENAEEGYERFAALSLAPLDAAAFHAAVALCVTRGWVRDPIHLPDGALQCHWRFRLTAAGTAAARESAAKGASPEINNLYKISV